MPAVTAASPPRRPAKKHTSPRWQHAVEQGAALLRRPHLLFDLLTHVVCGSYAGRARLLSSAAFFIGLFLLVRLHRYNAVLVTRFEQRQRGGDNAAPSLHSAIAAHARILVLFAMLLCVDASLVMLTVSWLVKSDVYALQGHGSSSSTLLAALYSTALPALLWCSMARYCVEVYDSFLNDARAAWTSKMTTQTCLHACMHAIDMLNGLTFMLFSYESACMRSSLTTMALPIAVALARAVSGAVGITQCARIAYRDNTHAARLVDKLPRCTTNSHHDDDERCCLICRDDVIVPATARRLPCTHAFHKDCLQAWLAWKLECPTCRAPLVCTSSL